MANNFLLSFAEIPFVLDRGSPVSHLSGSPVPCESLLERLNRILPFSDLQDFYNSREYPNRNTGALARRLQTRPDPSPEVKIGEWHYPNGAGKFSVFRGLATSSQMRAMLSATSGGQAATFVMKCVPDSPESGPKNYTLASQMLMLPPRPLAEHGGDFDGLYLITLVDERFNWRTLPHSIRVTSASRWDLLINELGDALGVGINYSPIETVYGRPEPDSQLWANSEDAASLLDCLAANVGRTVVRQLDGNYQLYTPAESRAVVQSNRGTSKVVRLAGGDIFCSGVNLKGGNLNPAKNSVCPGTVSVTFPKYVYGNDPVPHFVNPRESSVWYQESYGETHQIDVPIKSGGVFSSGLTGAGSLTIQDTAKALLVTELSTIPDNVSGLTALAMKLAGDYYGSQAAAALDEVYPGTLAWSPEGIHDIVWTYSAGRGLASCRVMRDEWTSYVREMQHGTPIYSGGASGAAFYADVGGPLVSQIYRDSANDVRMVNLATFYAPLRVDDGVRTGGGVIEAVVALGAIPGAADHRGEGGTVNWVGTTFNYYGGGQAGGSSTFTNYYGLNYVAYNNGNVGGSSSYTSINYNGNTTVSYNGNTSVSYQNNSVLNVLNNATLNFSVAGSTSSSVSVNYYGGSVQNFYAGSFSLFLAGSVQNFQAGSVLIIDITNNAKFVVNNYPSNGSQVVDCFRFFSFCQHLQNVQVIPGQTVPVNAKIAELGMELPGGAHLHFAVGDSYTGNPITTGSLVGNTLNLNPGATWFAQQGMRVLGGQGPNAPSFTGAQISWLRSRLRRPVDPQFFWIEQLGSQFHVGADYYAVDIHTLPFLGLQGDQGKNVYNLVDSADVLTRVVGVFHFANGDAVVLQHDKISDGCVPSPLVAPGTPTDPPCVDFNATTLVFPVNFTFKGAPGVSLTFDFPIFIFPQTTVLNFFGPTNYYNYNTYYGGVKFYDGWWLHYRDRDLSGAATWNDLDLTTDATDRVVVRVTLDRNTALTGMVPTDDGGSGQVVWLTNVSAVVVTLTLKHFNNGSSVNNRFLCPDEDDLLLPLYGSAICWYDPAATGWRVIGVASQDVRVKVTSDDTTPDYLQPKLVAGSNITITRNNPAGNETLTISAAGASADELVRVSATDTTAAYLQPKLVAGSNITITRNNPAGNETLTIAASAGGTTSTNGSSSVTVVTVTNAWANSGAAVTLPAAGTYLLTAQVSATLNSGTNGDLILARLRNTTDGASVGDTAYVCCLQGAGISGSIETGTATITTILTVAAVSKVITLQSQYSTIMAPNTATLGTVTLNYIQLA